eukprot:1245545-Rhodomonas_salina.1
MASGRRELLGHNRLVPHAHVQLERVREEGRCRVPVQRASVKGRRGQQEVLEVGGDDLALVDDGEDCGIDVGHGGLESERVGAVRQRERVRESAKTRRG